MGELVIGYFVDIILGVYIGIKTYNFLKKKYGVNGNSFNEKLTTSYYSTGERLVTFLILYILYLTLQKTPLIKLLKQIQILSYHYLLLAGMS